MTSKNPNPINIRVTNSAAITAGSYWFPLSEAGALTKKQYEEDLPLKNYALENQSTEEIDIILDPAPLSSGKRWTLPANKTRESDPTESLRFHNVVIVNNDGAAQIEIGELEFHARNY